MANKKVQNQTPAFGIASLICSLMSFVVFGIILSPLGVIFGIVSLAKNEKSKGFAITGMIVGSLVFVFMLYYLAVFTSTYNMYRAIQ